MPVRPSMSYLITFVRELITDSAGVTQTFTDQQIQDRLDLNRQDIYAQDLNEADSLGTDGTIEWHDFYAKLPFWEEDAVIQEADGTVRTPDESNYMLGRFHFDDHVDTLPLVISGKVYDIYNVAADMIMIQVNEMRGAFNWTADGTTVQRISQVKDMTNLAKDYRMRGWNWAKQIKLVRKDLRN